MILTTQPVYRVPTHTPLSLTTRPFCFTATKNAFMETSKWLENHPQKVVILVCRDFEGMMEDLHKYLIGCIKNICGRLHRR